MSSGDSPGAALIFDDFQTMPRSFGNRSNWGYKDEPVWYQGSTTLLNGTNITSPFNAYGQNLTTIFKGTSISIFGSSLSTSNDPSVTIDHGDTQSIVLPQPGVHTIWYRSPPLSDAEHTIQFTGLELMNVDYSIVTAGDSTSWSRGDNLVVDDSAEAEIWYRGQWEEHYNKTVQTDKITGDTSYSLNETVHVSSNIADSFEFQFAGTSIAIYGTLDLLPEGNFTLEFNLDGGTSIARTNYPLEGGYKLRGYNTLTNYMFHENRDLSPGNHTLLVNLTAVEGSQSFQLDYLVYQPTFTTVTQKPVFIRSDMEAPSSSRLPIGAIVGGTVGGTVILLAIGVFMFWRKRRAEKSKEEQMTNGIEPFSTAFNPDRKTIPAKRRPISRIPGIDSKVLRQQSETERVLSLGTRPPLLDPITAGNSQLQQRLNEISVLSAELAQSDVPTRGELYERIEALKRENERLMRDYVLPPEYDGSNVGIRRAASRSATLPSYDNGPFQC